MATNFPTSLQDLDATRGTATQKLNSPSHVTHHQTEDDTIEALQVKVGVDSSAVTTSLDYKIATLTTTQATKLTNPLTTTGDIIYSSSGTTGARLAIGTAGQHLAVNSGANGLEWTSTGAGDVTASANITDNAIVRGDGGSKGIQESGILIDDSDNLSAINNIVIGGTAEITGSATIGVNLAITSDLTAATYGGITESNLVDKSTTETISDTWTFSDIKTTGTAEITGSATIGVNLGLTGDILVSGSAEVTGSATVGGDIDVTGDVGGATIGEITEANLLDKSATETITGAWTFPDLYATGSAEITGSATIGGNLGITGTASAKALDLTVANGGNDIPLVITQSDTTNNPEVVRITNSANKHALYIDQAGVLDSNQLGMNIYSDAAQTQGAALIRYMLDNASSTIPILRVQNDGTGNGILIDTNNTAVSLNIDSEATTGNVITVDSQNTAGDLLKLSVNTAEKFAVDYTGAVTIGNAFTLPVADGSDGQVLTTAGNGTVAWETPAGGGDVTAAANITATRIVIGDDGVKGIKESGVSIDASDNITAVNNIAIGGTAEITGSATIGVDLDITGDLTAATYGAITEANLVDKSATETISGVWTFGKIKTTGTAEIGGSATVGVNLAVTGSASTAQLTATKIDAFTLNGKLTGGTQEIEGTNFDINGGTVDGISSLTSSGDLDIGAHDFRAATITSDGLTTGRIVITTTNGRLADDSTLLFGSSTMTLPRIKTTGTAEITGSATIGKNLSIGGTATTGTAVITALTVTSLTRGNVSDTEFGYLNGVSSAIQTQLDAKMDEIMVAQGDVIYGGTSGSALVLSIGNSNQVLTVTDAGTGIEWTTLASGGDVTAASNITDNRLVRGDGGAKGIQESGITIDDSDNVSGINNIAISGTAEITGSATIGINLDVTGSASTAELTATKINAFTLNGKLTAGAQEIEGTNFDINGGTVDAITSLTAGGNLDIGAYDFRAATITPDGLTTGRVVITTTNGQLADNSAFLYGSSTLTLPKIKTTGTAEITGSATVGGNLAITGTMTPTGTAVMGTATVTNLTATTINAFVLGGKLTGGVNEIEGSLFDINGGTVDGISSLTSSGNLDIGAYDFRAATITPDGLTTGRVVYTTTNGRLTDEAVFLYDSASDKLTTGTAFMTNIRVSAVAYFDAEVNDGNSGTADVINWTTGNKHKSTLTGNCTYTFTAPPGPCNLIFKVKQDGTGGRTVTWPGTCQWAGGVAPVLTSTANGTNIISFYYDGAVYLGQGGTAFA